MRTWKKVSSREIYQNEHTTVVVDDVISPGGEKDEYCHVIKMDGVVVIPFDGESVYFVEQQRYPTQSDFIELPMGGSNGEDVTLAASRELKEETNMTAKDIKKIGEYVLSPGFSKCKMEVAVATGLDTKDVGQINQEHNEAIHRVFKLSIEEIKQHIKDGKINDGHTLSSLNIFFNSQH